MEVWLEVRRDVSLSFSTAMALKVCSYNKQKCVEYSVVRAVRINTLINTDNSGIDTMFVCPDFSAFIDSVMPCSNSLIPSEAYC